jgi:hypothetical protein
MATHKGRRKGLRADEKGSKLCVESISMGACLCCYHSSITAATRLACEVLWCDVMWCDVMWCDVMWYEIWCDVMWWNVMKCDVMWGDVMSDTASYMTCQVTTAILIWDLLRYSLIHLLCYWTKLWSYEHSSTPYLPSQERPSKCLPLKQCCNSICYSLRVFEERKGDKEIIKKETRTGRKNDRKM